MYIPILQHVNSVNALKQEILYNVFNIKGRQSPLPKGVRRSRVSVDSLHRVRAANNSATKQLYTAQPFTVANYPTSTFDIKGSLKYSSGPFPASASHKSGH